MWERTASEAHDQAVFKEKIFDLRIECIYIDIFPMLKLRIKLNVWHKVRAFEGILIMDNYAYIVMLPIN